jgi:hypothetical protein
MNVCKRLTFEVVELVKLEGYLQNFLQRCSKFICSKHETIIANEFCYVMLSLDFVQDNIQNLVACVSHNDALPKS